MVSLNLSALVIETVYYFIHVAAAAQSGAGLLFTGLVQQITDHEGVEVTYVDERSLTVWV